MKYFIAPLLCLNSLFGITVTSASQVAISSSQQLGNYDPQVALNPSDQGIAAWAQQTTSVVGTPIWISFYTGGSWSTPIQLSYATEDGSVVSVTGSSPLVGISSSGIAFITWITSSQIFVGYNNVASPSALWTVTQLSSNATTSSTNTVPVLAVNLHGVAAVAWLSYVDGPTIPSIYLSCFDGSSTWSAPALLVTPPQGTANSQDIISAPVIALDNTALHPGPVSGQILWQNATQNGVIYQSTFSVTP